MFVDPVRDIYEVYSNAIPLPFPQLTPLGLHDIYIPPAPDQLSQRRTISDHYDARPRTSSSFMASESLSC